MNPTASARDSSSSWNRTVLLFYWMLAGMIFLMSSSSVLLDANGDFPGWEGWFQYQGIRLSLVLAAILVTAEAYLLIIRCCVTYAVLLYGTVISCTIFVMLKPHFEGALVAMDLQVLASIFYFDRSKTGFAAGSTLVGYTALILMVPEVRASIEATQVLVLLGMVTCTCLMGHAIRLRGIELMHARSRALRAEMQAHAETAALELASKQDYLTGLYNHIAFQDSLTLCMELAERDGHRLHLAVIDLDNFKCINDTYGHQAGDTLLRRTAGIIAATVRENDIPCRYGGEEFAIILRDKSTEECVRILESIRAAMEQATFPELAGERVTLSAGLCARQMGWTKDQFFEYTDRLLYHAKHHGKNQVSTSDEGSVQSLWNPSSAKAGTA